MGLAFPPLNNLLCRLEAWLETIMPSVPCVLVHGDPHLRNVMVRHHGTGLAVRFIDPNPEQGFTDPAYDFGKLLHFAEPVGWALGWPQMCRAAFSHAGAAWTLNAHLHDAPASSKRRQAYLEREVHKRIGKLNWAQNPTWLARLHVSRASAHLGLLTRFSDPNAREARLFVLAHALAALAAWDALVPAT